MLRILLFAIACQLLSVHALAQETRPAPPGGNPVPWAAVSIHPTAPGDTNWNGGDQANGINEHAASLVTLISQAYAFSVFPVRDDEIEGLPEWAKSARYDVTARVDPDDVEAFRKMSDLSLTEVLAAFGARQTTGEMLMEQALLTDRFHLKVHWEQRERNVYVLTIAKGGLRMKPAADSKHGSLSFSGNKVSGTGVPIYFIASVLSYPAQRTVLDRTNEKGEYDFDLHFAPPSVTAAGGTSSEPDFFTAVQEQLGLKLESEKAQVPVLVIDHIEQPTPN